jgi:hypothetical protein
LSGVIPLKSLILALSAVISLLAPPILSAQYRFLENGNALNRGADAGFLLDTPTREKIDLSGTWKYDVEGGPSGTVLIPSAFDFVGKASFEKTFVITAEQVDRYQFALVMYGANYSCEVSINGDFILSHSGGYTSFVQPLLPGVLQVGSENVIRVTVGNQLDPKKTLPLRSHVWGWRNYGGILRDVFVLATPKYAISTVSINSEVAPSKGPAKITIQAALEGKYEPKPGTIEPGQKQPVPGFFVEVFDKISGFAVVRSAIVPLTRNQEGVEKIKTEVTLQNPKLWSPEFPELYLVKCFLVESVGKEFTVLDEYDQNHGIRTVDLSGGGIALNGKKFVLKGVVWQEDHPTYGSALGYEDLERDIVLIKNLGANAVRFGNHPPHPYMLNLCDRYGLFALEELPIAGVPAAILTDEYFSDLASTLMKEMIARDKHHASVLAWGIGDEFESSSDAARGFVETLVALAKSLDTRPVYYGSALPERDVCSDLADLAVLNVHTRDIKVFKKLLDDWKKAHPEKPVLVGKFGTEVQHGNRNGYSDPLSYEAQARFFIQRFDIIKSLGYDGAFVWSLNDWKGDRPALTVNSGDPWMHTMGLVSGQREKRLAYEAVRTVFRGEKFVALPIGNHSTSAPIIYVLTGLVVLIGAAYFYNANRRFRDNVNRSVLNSYNFFADVRDQRLVSVLHSTILALIVSIAGAIVASSMLYHFRDSRVLDDLLSYLLVYDNIKEYMVQLVWNPLRFIAYFSGIFFVMVLLAAFLVYLVSALVKSRVFVYHAYVVTVWSTTPLLLLVPVGMIVYRIMESPVYVVPSMILVAILFAWVVLRLLKGISIMFDVYAIKVYVLGMLSIASVLAVVYFYFDYTQSTATYLTFMYSVMSNSQ